MEEIEAEERRKERPTNRARDLIISQKSTHAESVGSEAAERGSTIRRTNEPLVRLYFYCNRKLHYQDSVVLLHSTDIIIIFGVTK